MDFVGISFSTVSLFFCVLLCWQEWHVYVDQSKSSLEKGGSATLDAFLALVPPDGSVQVHAALLPKTSKVATKGPAVRCIPTVNAKGVGGSSIGSLSPMDIANVDSVDKVYRVLTKHMSVKVCA
jgi:hypothetical protein